MTIYEEAEACCGAVFEIRHDLHRCPELGHREWETTKYIRRCLEEWGAEVLELGFPTGVAARIRGGGPGKLLALREDIDALPILENTGLPFASQVRGMSHACGHDIHTAALLGCAKLLLQHRKELRGDVLLVFQCGEETFDGAASMLEQGLFQSDCPEAVVGFHCEPSLPVGTVGVRVGIDNASCDSLRLEVEGRGGHGAHPEACVDPVVISAGLIVQLQTLVSRYNAPQDPVVLTFGEIHGGTAPNVIPDTVTIRGTLRTLDRQVRKRQLEALQKVAPAFCQAMGGSCTVTIEKEVPPLINTPDLCRQLERTVERVLVEGHMVTLPTPSIGSDDFSCLLEACGDRGMQFLLGTRQEGVPQSGLGLHVEENIFPDQALLPAVAVLTQFALDYLSGERG